MDMAAVKNESKNEPNLAVNHNVILVTIAKWDLRNEMLPYIQMFSLDDITFETLSKAFRPRYRRAYGPKGGGPQLAVKGLPHCE